jgi:hypothetical protein
MVEYEVNDKVVFRFNDVNEVAVITNVRRHKKIITGYDIRSEKGSGYVLVQVDVNLTTRQRNKRVEYPLIDSKLTAAWIGSDSETNLFAKENVGHTRQNFTKDMVLVLDGEAGGGVQHLERHNDLIFPTQGPRSF